MTENSTKLSDLRNEIYRLKDKRVSIICLQDAFIKSEQSFVDFFGDIYFASTSDENYISQLKLYFTYYEDLCEMLPKELALSFSKQLELEDVTPEAFLEYCQSATFEIEHKIKPLEKEKSKLLFTLARESLNKAA